MSATRLVDHTTVETRYHLAGDWTLLVHGLGRHRGLSCHPLALALALALAPRREPASAAAQRAGSA
jgi:hypothetical protein